MTNPNKPTNVAEGKMFDCSNCKFNQIIPHLDESCEGGLWVSRGVAKCGTTNDVAGMQKVRKGTSIERGEGCTGVTIAYDEEGLLLNSQYRVRPNLSQRWLARIGVNEALWDPEDL